MKKKYILLLVTIYSFCAAAQITISGAATYTVANGSYVANSDYILSPFYNLGTKDFGTFSYSFANSSTNSVLWIVRKSNYWQIEQHYSGGPILILYVASSINNDLIPPCNATWQVWTGGWGSYYGIPPAAFTGNTETSILLSGGCMVEPMLSASINPSNIQLPLLTTSLFSAISNLNKGMLSYSINRNTPMVYDGANWKEVVLNRDTDFEGKLSVNGSLLMRNTNKIIFGNGFSVNDKFIGESGTDLVINNGLGTWLRLKYNAGVMISGPTLSVDGSVDYHIKMPNAPTQTGDFIGTYNHTYINNGTNSLALTIPDPTTCRGRYYYIINHGSQNIITNYLIKTGYSTQTNSILPQERFHIVSDGTYWHLAN